MKYPKVYKPDGMRVFINVFFIILIIFYLFTQIFPLSDFRFYQPHDGEKFWVSLIGFAFAFGFIFVLAIQVIGYRVIFMPDAITVTTLLGTKTMQYSDISFYRWDMGPAAKPIGPWMLYLVSRDPAQSVLDISLLKGPREKSLTIFLNLKFDQEFDGWIASMPCEIGHSPLPPFYLMGKSKVGNVSTPIGITYFAAVLVALIALVFYAFTAFVIWHRPDLLIQFRMEALLVWIPLLIGFGMTFWSYSIVRRSKPIEN